MKSPLKNKVGSILNSYEADRSNFEIVDFCQKWIHRRGKAHIFTYFHIPSYTFFFQKFIIRKNPITIYRVSACQIKMTLT